jgi:hypothetical protein
VVAGAALSCAVATGAFAQEPAPLALNIAAQADGGVAVNGVVFEADLGLSAEEIVTFVDVARFSASFGTMHDPAVVERVDAVLATLGLRRPQ